jgi:hypothetical protein
LYNENENVLGRVQMIWFEARTSSPLAVKPVVARFALIDDALRKYHRTQTAIDKAPSASCNACVLEAFCTPHDEGRHVYRSLAA